MSIYDLKLEGKYLSKGIYSERYFTDKNKFYLYLVYRNGKGKAKVISSRYKNNINNFIDFNINDDISNTFFAYTSEDNIDTRLSYKINIKEDDILAIWEDMIYTGRKIFENINHEVEKSSLINMFNKKTIFRDKEVEMSNAIIGTIIKYSDLKIKDIFPLDFDIKKISGISINLLNDTKTSTSVFQVIDNFLKKYQEVKKNWDSMKNEEQKEIINKIKCSKNSDLIYKGIDNLAFISSTLIYNVEINNQEEKLKKIEQIMCKINSNEEHSVKMAILEETNLSNIFENTYAKQLINQYQNIVIENNGKTLDSMELSKIRLPSVDYENNTPIINYKIDVNNEYEENDKLNNKNNNN